MDKGSWLFAAIAVLVVSFALQFAVNSKIIDTYAVSPLDFYLSNSTSETEWINEGQTEMRLTETQYKANSNAAKKLNHEKRPFPIIGKNIFWFFSFNSNFFSPLITLSLFYLPASIILLTLLAHLGNLGVVLRRDYSVFAACSLMAWTAAHLPFVVLGILLPLLDGSVYLGFWFASGLLFGVLMVFAMRTVFGVEYGKAIITTAISWTFYCAGTYVFAFISPWLFSPFLLFFAIIYLGGFLGSEVRGLGNSMRQKRDLKRFLQNATINPNDADAHLQLGLIYKKRHQDEKALDHFSKAFEIDNEEIDANYELGKIARKDGDLQKAINHFAVVVEQNDKYSLSDVWREIGATYFEADMLKEAFDALDKFVTRRAFDAEGLYYFGKLLQKQDKAEQAKKMFTRSIDAVKTAAYYRRGELRKWSKLSQKEL